MEEYAKFREIIRALRAPDGCPWDREQTHVSLKPGCIEEAAEVISGINIYEQTGNADNMCEELGDLLLIIFMQAQIAEEEGLFTMEDVLQGITEKMIRRHPHVFGDAKVKDSAEVLKHWDEIKAEEKAKKVINEENYLFPAFEEAKELIDSAKERKLRKRNSQ